jgi:hypothetical protein
MADTEYGKPNVQGYPARCGKCEWHGTDRQLIWVFSDFRGFFRCPQCHSHEIWIRMSGESQEGQEE